MIQEIEIAVNLYYKEWIKTNDNYEAMPDFEMLLEEAFKNYKFTQLNGEWKIISIF
jgi:hypothetical protein